MIMSSEATWHGRRNCRLTLHYENGFTLTADTDGIVENGGGGGDSSRGAVAQTILWHYPFEKLQMSSDDGRRLLWLDFGDDGEQVLLTFKIWGEGLILSAFSVCIECTRCGLFLPMFATFVCESVCLSRGSSRLHCAQMAEQIKILFGVNTPGGHRQCV